MSEQTSLFDTESITLNTIDDTPHEYHLVDTFDKRVELIGKLNNHIISNQEICFDTETTGLDANLCELVGMSFSIKEHEGYYISFSSLPFTRKNRY